MLKFFLKMMTSSKMTSSIFSNFTHIQYGFYESDFIHIIKPAIMLKNNCNAFRKSKQNWKIFICSGFIVVLVKGTFYLVSGNAKTLWWRHHLYDDVINLKFFPWVPFMEGKICAKFHYHNTSTSKVIQGWWIPPPPPW